ncbi:amidohydrolase family protein [Roseomonas populi]|uniref:Amidohydrolase family protein n=1 Tax=Roseomonas populi TaxID=3121582 RepID=A0ABT1X5F9_9PROT|nr:amidohydrolase family protein [Roseomonas pecuniae]MCR0983338.1 amidohydrolase family protein [Roseomonas pecuniae]
MVQKIALEEHFMIPSMEAYWRPTVEDLPPARLQDVHARLSDFGESRLASMDAAGIARAVLSLAGPGVQAERDPATAIRAAQGANDALAEQIARRPDRYSGFAHLPMQDGKAAADELERCVTQLGLVGALVNGQTDGLYLSDEKYEPFWERAAALGAPVYIHPNDPPAPYGGWADEKILSRAMWGWTVETATHALRLVTGGTFDRHPKAQVILGHMGETLPFLLWRLDSRIKLYKQDRPLKRAPSDYIRENIAVTTSGQCAAEPLLCTLASLGEDRVMFAVDYPFEEAEVAGSFLDAVPVSDAVRERIASGNAKRLLKL